ncbi:S-adenosyl-L-methionine-dependent methyltransferase [Acephala macrosclerotiorum]|nr:S-adenosyl-L-methionine-dependent methyltransferase [Acephala macrosclerotiorum]
MAPNAMSSDLPALVEAVQREAKAIADFCEANASPSPSFSQAWPDDLPENIQASRMKLREAAKAIHDIATGPHDHLFAIAWSYHSVSTLRWLLHFKIPEAVGLVGSVSYSDIASTCGVNVSHLRRILRFCMVNRLFHEPQPDHVAHSFFSASLLTNKVLVGELEFLCEDAFNFSTKIVEAHEKWPNSEEGNHAAFNVACGTDLQRYPWLAQPGHEQQATRFSHMLDFARQERATDVRFVVQGYSWQDVDTVVDIGGGSGDVAITLAKAFPQLHVTVEDQAHSISKSTLPSELQDRIQLVERDFFQPRPTEPDAVSKTKTYFLRMVLHNWSDKHAARIIQPLLPSVRAGAKLLIMEIMVPPPGTLPETLEWWMRSLDMEMTIEFNSRMRSKEDWERLFQGVDSGLVMKSTTTPHGSGLTVMEFGFEK